MHLIAEPYSFRADTPPSDRRGLRPFKREDQQLMRTSGAAPRLHPTSVPPGAQPSHYELMVIETEGAAPRCIWVVRDSKIEDLSELECAALYEFAAARGFLHWDELPARIEKLKWARRERPTDPDVEIRAAQLRQQLAALQSELAATEQLLADQASGEFDRRLAAAAEAARKDAEARARRQAEEGTRALNKLKIRKAAKQVLEQLGAAALGIELDVPGSEKQVDWAGVEKRKKELLAKTTKTKPASAADGAPLPLQLEDRHAGSASGRGVAGSDAGPRGGREHRPGARRPLNDLASSPG